MPGRYAQLAVHWATWRLLKVIDGDHRLRSLWLLLAIRYFGRQGIVDLDERFVRARYAIGRGADQRITIRQYFAFLEYEMPRRYCSREASASFLRLSMGMFLADVLSRQGLFSEAEALYRWLAAPGRPSAYEAACGLADLMLVQARWGDEFDEYEHNVQLVDAWRLFGIDRSPWAQRHWREVVDLLDRPCLRKSDDDRGWWLLAIAFTELADAQNAARCVVALLQILPAEDHALDRLRNRIEFWLNPTTTPLLSSGTAPIAREASGRAWTRARLDIVHCRDLPAAEGFELFEVDSTASLPVCTTYIMDGCAKPHRRTVDYDPLSVVYYPKATILPMYGGIFGNDRYFVADSVHYRRTHLPVFTPQIRSQTQNSALLMAPVAKDYGKTNSVFLGSNGNYYHWLMDDLPRLKYLMDLDLVGSRTVVVDRQIKPWQVDLLRRFGVHENRLLKADLSEPSAFRGLIAPTSMVRGYACHPDAVAFVRSVLLKDVADAAPKRGKRVYLKRSRPTSVAGRIMFNAAEVEDKFRKAGFQMVDTGTLSVAEQMRLFADVEVVAGPAGAAMTNMAFAPKGARLIGMGAADVAGETFTTLTSAAEQGFFWCFGRGVPRPYLHWIWTDFDYTVDERDLDIALQLAL